MSHTQQSSLPSRVLICRKEGRKELATRQPSPQPAVRLNCHWADKLRIGAMEHASGAPPPPLDAAPAPAQGGWAQQPFGAPAPGVPVAVPPLPAPGIAPAKMLRPVYPPGAAAAAVPGWSWGTPSAACSAGRPRWAGGRHMALTEPACCASLQGPPLRCAPRGAPHPASWHDRAPVSRSPHRRASR